MIIIIIIIIIIYRLRTFNSSMWGSLRLAPFTADLTWSAHLQVISTNRRKLLGMLYRIFYSNPTSSTMLFTFLEDACHQLAIQHTLYVQLHGTCGGSTYQWYATSLRRQSTLRDNTSTVKLQTTSLEQILTLALLTVPMPYSDQLQQLNQNIAENRKISEKIVRTDYIITIIIF